MYSPTSIHRLLPSACFGSAFALALLLAGCDGDSGSSSGSSGGGTGTPSTPNNPTPPTTPATPVLFFGAQAHFGQGWNVDLVPRITAGGMADVRDELYWQMVESSAGVFSFPANYDAYMTALRNAGISPLITLSFENTNYDGGQTPYTNAGFDGYARYATEVLKKYGTQVTAVEIWNEYNGSFAKGPATSDRAGTYLKMLRPAYTAIKAARPDVTVIAGSTAGVPLPYFEKLFAAGALNSLDAVSIHPYRTASAPEGADIRQGLRAIGRERVLHVCKRSHLVATSSAKLKRAGFNQLSPLPTSDGSRIGLVISPMVEPGRIRMRPLT